MKNTTKLIYLLALLKFIIPFFLQAPAYEPHRDELLYLQEAHHMAWGFMEVPPLLSVFAWVGQWFGNGMFWIKCWPSLFGAFTYIVVGRIILSLGGRYFALLLGWLPFIFGAYMRVDFLFQPNFLDQFFWTLMAYALIRVVQTGQTKWLYLFGISIGLGMESKYTGAFFAVSLLAGLALTSQRRLFANKHLYYALGLGLLIFLPNLAWEAAHHFPVIFHMNTLQAQQLQYVSPAEFLSAQMVMNLPCVFVWVAGLRSLILGSWTKEYRFLAWAYLSVIVILLILHGKGYYSLGVYPVLFAFGARRLERLASDRRGWMILRTVFVGIPLLLGYFALPLAMPMMPPASLAKFYEKRHLAKYGLLRWEDHRDHPLPEDFADMLSWKEMTQKAAQAYATLDSNEKKHTLVFCDNYGEAGALDYYGKRYGLPEAYSDNASFLYWLPDTLVDHLDNLLLVTDDHHEMEHPFVKEFVSATVMDSITNPYAREAGTMIIIFKHANQKMQNMFRGKIIADKVKTRTFER